MATQLHRSRRRVHFTREGWYFIFILAFIVFGSILRQINLLIVLAGMMIPALLFNWRMAVGMLRKLTIRHRCAEWIFAGRTTMLEIEIRNHSTWVDAWNVAIADEISMIRTEGTAGSTAGPGRTASRETALKTAHLAVPNVPRQDTSDASYRGFFAARGLYQIGPANLSCRFPFGLVQASVRMFDNAELYVAPRLGDLHPNWHKRLGSVAIGTSSTERKRGPLPDEYYGIRQWTSGDTQRWIHWRSTAKRNELMVKQFDQPTDRDFALALDLNSDGSDARNRDVEVALSFVATLLSRLNLSVHGRVAIAVCGAESFLYVNELAGDFIRSVMQHLAVARPAARTELAYQLPQLAGRVSLGTPLIVVTTRPPEEIDSLRVLWKDDSRFQATENILWVRIPSDEFPSLFSPAAEHDFSELPIDQPELVAKHIED
jgi:uncharacterized protein (DUF58 family)